MVLRGGSTKIIMCGAETSDPLAPVRGSFESRDRDPSNKKKSEVNKMSENIFTSVSVNESGFSCLNFNGEFVQFHA